MPEVFPLANYGLPALNSWQVAEITNDLAVRATWLLQQRRSRHPRRQKHRGEWMASCCLSDQTLACPGGRYVAISVARLCCCMVARKIGAFSIEQHNFVQVYVIFSDISMRKT